MRRRHILAANGLLAATLSLGACAENMPVAADRPADKRKHEYYVTFQPGGFVYVSRYFTRAEMRDATTEADRLRFLNSNIDCKDTKHVVRRDVRWFPATALSGQACAIVIYSVRCGDPAGPDGLGPFRNMHLYGEPQEPIGPACSRDITPRPAAATLLARDRSIITDAAVCDRRRPTLNASIALRPRTRIAVTGQIERGLADLLLQDGRGAWDFARSPADILRYSLERSDHLSNIFPLDNIVSRNPANIRVTMAMGLGAGTVGPSYCLQLTARQGGRTWRRTIERSWAARPASSNADRPLAQPPTMRRDIVALTDMLSAALGLPATPVEK